MAVLNKEIAVSPATLDSATVLFEMYQGYLLAGFPEPRAFELVKDMVSGLTAGAIASAVK